MLKQNPFWNSQQKCLDFQMWWNFCLGVQLIKETNQSPYCLFWWNVMPCFAICPFPCLFLIPLLLKKLKLTNESIFLLTDRWRFNAQTQTLSLIELCVCASGPGLFLNDFCQSINQFHQLCLFTAFVAGQWKKVFVFQTVPTQSGDFVSILIGQHLIAR